MFKAIAAPRIGPAATLVPSAPAAPAAPPIPSARCMPEKKTKPGLRRIVCVAAALALAFSIQGAQSQPAPTIKIIVPVPPGAALDVLSHLLADQIGRTQHRTIVIEYRPGANSLIGTEAVARAAPDGNTLLVNAPAPFVVIPHLQKLNYDPLTSFEPICNLVNFPDVIAVNSRLALSHARRPAGRGARDAGRPDARERRSRLADADRVRDRSSAPPKST